MTTTDFHIVPACRGRSVGLLLDVELREGQLQCLRRIPYDQPLAIEVWLVVVVVVRVN